LKAVAQNKKELRGYFRGLLAGLAPFERKLADKLICKSLLSLEEFKNAHSIMTYLSFADEVDTLNFARRVLECGKRLIVPKVQTQKKNLLPCEVKNLEEGLLPGLYGILEPDESHTHPVEAGEIDFHVIPALALDRSGFRLGRGGGYYDRFLSKIEGHFFTVGICYNCQLVEELPRETWDIPVNCIVTENGIIHLNETNSEQTTNKRGGAS
jgi:5-formyltetrahydrofolate cyclo-ligase